MVDTRLDLPLVWCNDSKRYDEAGIPVNEREFKTKLELAIEIIPHQISLRTCFDFISADGYYGSDASFAHSIEDMGLLYMLDVHSVSLFIWNVRN